MHWNSQTVHWTLSHTRLWLVGLKEITQLSDSLSRSYMSYSHTDRETLHITWGWLNKLKHWALMLKLSCARRNEGSRRKFEFFTHNFKPKWTSVGYPPHLERETCRIAKMPRDPGEMLKMLVLLPSNKIITLIGLFKNKYIKYYCS